MHKVDQRKMKMALEFQKELPPELLVKPGNDGWLWNITDAATLEPLEPFTLEPARVATLRSVDDEYRIDDYARGVIRNALDRLKSQANGPRK